MKKIVASLIFIVLLISSTIVISANDLESNVYYYDELGVEIIFESNNSLFEDERERIADILAYDLDVIESRSWCRLTGHDKVIHTVTKVTHKVRSIEPRCAGETFNITTCENCNYYEEELIGQ